MTIQQATVSTPNASRYLVQLCKHFAHKIPVKYDTSRGRAEFLWGTCAMQADNGLLILRCEAAGDDDLARVKAVVDDHLTRFAWRESLSWTWVHVP